MNEALALARVLVQEAGLTPVGAIRALAGPLTLLRPLVATGAPSDEERRVLYTLGYDVDPGPLTLEQVLGLEVSDGE